MAGVKRLLDAVMARRARTLARVLRGHLPPRGRVLDLGCGTGHTAQALAAHGALTVVGADVVDLSVVGPPPVLFTGATLPFPDASFDGALVLFVLAYAPDPAALLAEARRVTRGPVLVLQSTYRGARGRAALRANEFLWGPVAFRVARAAGFIGDCGFSLRARRLYTRAALRSVFRAAGVAERALHATPWRMAPVSRDLFVLQGSA